MRNKPLTDTQIRAMKPRRASYKISDGGGLHLLVAPNGAKTWRLAYRFAGRQRCLTLGPYPKLTLAAARFERETAKARLREKKDPAAPAASAAVLQAPTFKEAAQAWHTAQLSRWTSAYAIQVLTRIEADLFPDLGDLPVNAIPRVKLVETLRKVEARGTLETARRLRQYAGAVFRFAGATDETVIDPTPMLKGALKTPPRSRHHAALRGTEIGTFLRDLDAYQGETLTKIAITLALHTVVRTGELIAARWTEFEALDTPDAAVWRIPEHRMKMRMEHLVPLTPEVRAVLATIRSLTGKGAFLFPAADGRPGHISNNTMLFAAYRMGYRGRTTIHGFRRLFSTEANEHGWPSDHIEMQLAHDERDAVRGAYNAAQYLAGRRALMRWWSQRLENLRTDQ